MSMLPQSQIMDPRQMMLSQMLMKDPKMAMTPFALKKLLGNPKMLSPILGAFR